MLEPLELLERADLMDALKRTPDLLEELDVTLTRCDATGDIKVGGPIAPGMRERPLMYRADASDAKRELEAVLRTYTLRVARLINVAPPHLPHRRAQYLSRHVPGVPDDSPNLVGITIITAVVEDAEKVIDRPEERLCIGSCTDCDAYLYGTPDSVCVECDYCGRIWPAAEMRAALLDRVDYMVGTAAQLSRILPWFLGKPFSTDRIRKWGARGKITGTGTVDGRTLYRVRDVLDMIRRGE